MNTTMKKMMFLTLALSVMAMGSAMANDSAMDKSRKPNKVKIEINHNCCGDHSDRCFDAPKHHKHNDHFKVHRKGIRGPKLGCPVCEPNFHGKGMHKRGNEGKRPNHYYGELDNGFYGRPAGRH